MSFDKDEFSDNISTKDPSGSGGGRKGGRYNITKEFVDYIEKQVKNKGAVYVPRDKVETAVDYDPPGDPTMLKGFAVALEKKFKNRGSSVKVGYRPNPADIKPNVEASDSRTGHSIMFSPR